jgi:hypothetical protein
MGLRSSPSHLRPVSAQQVVPARAAGEMELMSSKLLRWR